MHVNKDLKMTPILVSVEGNIGAGKTTLFSALQARNPHWCFVPEPVTTWTSFRNNQGESLLQVFYENPRRWSYTFQNCALLTRCLSIEGSVGATRASGQTGKQLFVTERCLDTDRHVFTKTLVADGYLDKLENELHSQFFDAMKLTATPLSAIVHVCTDPTECAQRIRSRAREGEDCISTEYLKALHNRHTDWLGSLAISVHTTDMQSTTAMEDLEAFMVSLLE